jgi:hypothetical protein
MESWAWSKPSSKMLRPGGLLTSVFILLFDQHGALKRGRVALCQNLGVLCIRPGYHIQAFKTLTDAGFFKT